MNPNPRRRVARYVERQDVADPFHFRLIDNDLDEIEDTIVALAETSTKRIDRLVRAAYTAAGTFFAAMCALIANLLTK